MGHFEELTSIPNLNLLILNENFDIEEASIGFSQLMSVEKGQLRKTKAMDLFVSEDQKTFGAFCEVLRLNQRATDSFLTLRKKNGKKVVVDISGVGLDKGGHSFLVVNFNDITKVAKLLDKVEKMNSELSEMVKERTLELELANKKLLKLATLDSLTSLKNVRIFKEALETEILRAKRNYLEFSILLLDIDHFKNYNDKNGHLAGDNALKQMGKILSPDSVFDFQRDPSVETPTLRLGDLTDIICRYGGEEFAILLPHTSASGGITVAEGLVDVVRKTPFEFDSNQPGGKVTVSIGVSTYPENGDTIDELIDAADRALYQVKEQGRNNCFHISKLEKN